MKKTMSLAVFLLGSYCVFAQNRSPNFEKKEQAKPLAELTTIKIQDSTIINIIDLRGSPRPEKPVAQKPKKEYQ